MFKESSDSSNKRVTSLEKSSDDEKADSSRTSGLPDYGATKSTDEDSNSGKFNGRLIREKLRPKRRTREEQTLYENNIKDFLDALLSNTSLLAISNIVKRSHPVFKTLWAIAFTVCLILTIRQLYSLSRTYFSDPKSTIIQLSYKPFEFPSVTVCNHNPLRRSMVSLFGQPDLQRFIAGLETKNYSVVDNGTQLMTQQVDWMRFHRLISNHTPEQRLRMGYQMSDLILQCSFAGQRCNTKHFSVSLTKTYGSCFTFNGWQSAMAGRPVIGKNGREHGLILTLYLELEEYLQNFIPSSGIKVHIHEFGSLAFPETTGFSVPPGFQTSIGMSLRMINRINRPKGSCHDGEGFLQNHGFKYTYNACTMLCLYDRVHKLCGCYDRANAVYYSNLKARLKPCQTEEQLSCLMNTVYASDQGDLKCDCQLPCEESHFTFKQSLSEWPTDSYEMRLFGDLVDVKPKVADLKNQTKLAARRNLLNLVVYVDGVMAEHIIEKQAYAIDNYLSDIGGTLGLFLGFSVLTGFELLEASALIMAYLCGKIGYTSDEDDDQPAASEDSDESGDADRRQSISASNEALTGRRASQILTLYGSNPTIHLHSN
ncbi:hypothetical protein BOX15_Mlig031795g1 [Macrostomum lignano]|uniref:Acid-sensing ion channel 4 n=1 Tax=Macrostomum lignano TaxID=282301 RepID=A0A267F1U6_9PLAT|nr:hypothetical protein BOX15_Mlig031795g1 [Macrostomum lignano]